MANRKRNAIRNIVSGTAVKIFDMVMTFVMRAVLLYVLSIEYLGLNGLFHSILQILNLADMGIANAMAFAMFEPISKGQNEKVCAILNLFRKLYRIIGSIVAVVGILMIPFLKYLVKGDVPADISLTVLFLFNVAAMVSNYWLFGYKKTLLNALQRSDINSNVYGFSTLIRYALQSVMLLAFKSYYLYYICILIIPFCENLIVDYITRKKYPQYHPHGKVPEDVAVDIKNRVKALAIQKIGNVVLSSVDTIIISSFMGLKPLAVYQNYFSIILALHNLLWNINAAVTAGIGDSLITESTKKNTADLKKITLVYSVMLCVCACCLTTMFQPFMMVWMGKEFLLPYPLVLCLISYFVVYGYYVLFCCIKDASGTWQSDCFRPFVSSILNLCMNLLSVRVFGLYGIVLSTVIALLAIDFPWMIRMFFKEIYPKDERKSFVWQLLGSFAVIVGAIAVSCLWMIPNKMLNPWISVVGGAVFAVAVSGVTILLIFGKKSIFKESLALVVPDKIMKLIKK